MRWRGIPPSRRPSKKACSNSWASWTRMPPPLLHGDSIARVAEGLPQSKPRPTWDRPRRKPDEVGEPGPSPRRTWGRAPACNRVSRQADANCPTCEPPLAKPASRREPSDRVPLPCDCGLGPPLFRRGQPPHPPARHRPPGRALPRPTPRASNVRVSQSQPRPQHLDF